MNKVELKNMPYVEIPFEILQDKDLTDSELRLYMIISFLTYKTGYCYASNNYLGDMLGIKTRAVQTRLQKLEEKKYIFKSFEQNRWSAKQRKIEINKEIFK